MKFFTFILLLAACSSPATNHKPTVSFAEDIGKKTAYLIKIPVRDNTKPAGITSRDQDWILRSGVCPNAFQETAIVYAPLSPDGMSSKNITFYCL